MVGQTFTIDVSYVISELERHSGVSCDYNLENLTINIINNIECDLQLSKIISSEHIKNLSCIWFDDCQSTNLIYNIIKTSLYSNEKIFDSCFMLI